MNKSINLIGVAAMATVSSLSAQEISVSSTFAWESAYVFRGIQLGEESFQPSIEVAIDDFYVGIWASSSLDAFGGEGTVAVGGNEVDFYAGYGFAITDTISGDVGITHYVYPTAQDYDNGGNTTEIYAGASFDVPAAPSLYVYYDFDVKALTIEGSVGHSLDLADAFTLDVGAALGWVDIDDAGDYAYANASIDFSYSVNENSAISAGIRYGYNFDFDTFADFGDTPDDSIFWYGFSGSVSF